MVLKLYKDMIWCEKKRMYTEKETENLIKKTKENNSQTTYLKRAFGWNTNPIKYTFLCWTENQSGYKSTCLRSTLHTRMKRVS